MRVFMDNMIPGTIFDLDYGYAEVRLKVMIGHAEVDATVPREQVTEMGLARGVQVLICFDASRVLFATDRGRVTQTSVSLFRNGSSAAAPSRSSSMRLSDSFT